MLLTTDLICYWFQLTPRFLASLYFLGSNCAIKPNCFRERSIIVKILDACHSSLHQKNRNSIKRGKIPYCLKTNHTLWKGLYVPAPPSMTKLLAERQRCQRWTIDQIDKEKIFLMDGPLSKIYCFIKWLWGSQLKKDKILMSKAKELKRRKHVK